MIPRKAASFSPCEAFLVLLGISLAFSAWAHGQVASGTSETPPDVGASDEFRLPLRSTDAAHIDQLIAALGSPVFAQRESATAQLTSIGAPAFARLRLAYRECDDFEVRSRIEAIVKIAYVDRHVFAQYGFLGIQQDAQHTPGHLEDPRIPEGRVGIQIKRVHENTGAQRAGLRDGDMVILVDGQPMDGVGIRAVENFGQAIRNRGPGNRMRLTVLRGEEQIELDATLGSPPRDLMREITMRPLMDRIKKTESQFEVWWTQLFRGPETLEAPTISEPPANPDNT